MGALALGYVLGQGSHQNVNDLIGVGFTLTDPEGFDVSDFEEGYTLEDLQVRALHFIGE